MTLTLTLARAISEIYAVIDRADSTEIGFFDGSVISLAFFVPHRRLSCWG